jgi:hypothetical protein
MEWEERFICTGKDTFRLRKNLRNRAETVPHYTIAEPICITGRHLELKTALVVDKLLKPETAERDIRQIYRAVAVLHEFSARGIDEKI